MFVVRGVVGVLSLTSIVAVSLSVLLAQRHLDVEPDLGRRHSVVLPAPDTTQQDAIGQGSEADPGDDEVPTPGARVDPRRAVPVEPHDEGPDEDTAESGGGDRADRARDAEDRQRDAAEDAADAADPEDAGE